MMNGFLQASQEWVERLGGRPARPGRAFAARGVAGDRYVFDGLRRETDAPPLPYHYVSVSVAGPISVQARLGEARIRARLCAGQSVIMGAGCANSWSWDGPTEELLVFVSPEFVAEVADEMGYSARAPLQRIAVDDRVLRSAIVALADETAGAGAASALVSDVIARSIASRLLQRHCDASEQDPRRRAKPMTAAQLKRVVTLVEESLGGELHLDEMASAAGASRYHFVRAFAAATGMAPHRWLLLRRIEHAKRLLETDGASLVELAGMVGFKSQSHFGECFRAATSLTPREWRLRARSS